MRRAFVALICLYQRMLSPLLPAACRFVPSCSVYAVEAYERYGVLGGTRRAVGRLCRCHPWNPGGFDPVDKS